jgi:hypothetical protein
MQVIRLRAGPTANSRVNLYRARCCASAKWSVETRDSYCRKRLRRYLGSVAVALVIAMVVIVGVPGTVAVVALVVVVVVEVVVVVVVVVVVRAIKAVKEGL